MTETIHQLSKSSKAIHFIRCIYNSIDGLPYEFMDWKNVFSYLHGDFDKQKKVDFSKISDQYGIQITDLTELQKLIYSLECYYIFILKSMLNILVHKTKPTYTHNSILSYDLNISSFTIKPYYDAPFKKEEIQEIAVDFYKAVIDHVEISADNDFVRALYEELFNKRIRHSMGEFFTPDWLADLLVEQTVALPVNKDDKFLDPTCGTGTFINRILKKFARVTDGKIFDNVYGIDFNPVAVIAAKCNYIIQYIEYWGNERPLPEEIPIFEADVIKELIIDAPSSKLSQAIGRVDYIIGNPPWVNWEYLPTRYKLDTSGAWTFFNLYEAQGLDSNFLKEDISTLITYVVIYNYLKPSGKLTFLIKESLLKSIRQAKPFRKFHIKPTDTYLRVDKIIDLTSLRPFEGVNHGTVGLFLTYGLKTVYPIAYHVLSKSDRKKFPENGSYDNIKDKLNWDKIEAAPSDETDISSPLKTLDSESMELSKKLNGKSEYRARTGVFTGGANAVFRLRIIDTFEENVVVENINEKAKNKVSQVKLPIEKDLIYPLVIGADLGFWQYNYTRYILFPHTSRTKMSPLDLKEISSSFPLTLRYIEQFEEALKARKGFTGLDKNIHRNYYYTLQRIGNYTFAPYKVAWKYIGKNFTPCVIETVTDCYLGTKMPIPSEKVIYIGLDSMEEAYYLCGLLSSDIYSRTIESFMLNTQITPSIISNLKIERYDKNNVSHKQISELCREGHRNPGSITGNLVRINELVHHLI